MSAALPADSGGEGASAQDKLDAVIRSLTEAIDLLDSIEVPPELSARVQESLDAVTTHRASFGN